MTGVPDPWEFLLLVGAAWRTWTLLAADTILDPVRDRLLWTVDEDGNTEPRQRLIDWIDCPYCSGFWIATGWWAAWWATGHALIVAVPFAASAALIFAEATLDRLRGE